MTRTDDVIIFKENLMALRQSMSWLEHSIALCSSIKDFSSLSQSDYDNLELVTARYARYTDLLFNKIFRGIYLIEMGSNPSMLDSLFYLSKKGIVTSVNDIRFLKELRNDIVHEYLLENLNELYENVYKYSPVVLATALATLSYSEELISGLESNQ